MRDSCAFVIRCYNFPIYFVVVWKKRTFRLEKAASRQWKIYIMKKSNHVTLTHVTLREMFWITSSSSRFAWFELLMNRLGRKMSLTYPRHRNTSFIERVTKHILTNILLNLFTAINAPLDVYAAECEECGVYIAGDDFFETSDLPRSFSWGLERKCSF